MHLTCGYVLLQYMVVYEILVSVAVNALFFMDGSNFSVVQVAPWHKCWLPVYPCCLPITPCPAHLKSCLLAPSFSLQHLTQHPGLFGSDLGEAQTIPDSSACMTMQHNCRCLSNLWKTHNQRRCLHSVLNICNCEQHGLVL